MVSQQRLLPLFPLDAVLFPNATMPLHVFEERYKLMVRHCLDRDSEFGVVLIRSGSEVGDPAEPHSIGTLARIVEVDRLDDGRMNIAVRGQSRFSITEITQLRPYLEAQVETLVNDEGTTLPAPEMAAARQALARHIRLLLGLRGGWVREPGIPEHPAAMSFRMATVLQVDLVQKQALLEESSTAVRLRTARRLLSQEAEGLKARVAEELGCRLTGC